MSLSLKHIPCPAGEKCTAFQCIFGHAADKDRESLMVLTEDGTKRPHESDEALSANQMDEGPRKRFKSDHVNSVQDKDRLTASKEGAAKELKSASRPVSPPPLSKSRLARKTDREPSSPAASMANKKPPQACDSPQPASKATQPSKSKKAESLNPRLLKSSPASHEIRLKLLRMVHQEFARLNSELKRDGNDKETKLVMSDQELIIKALDEEQKTALEKGAVYTNVMKNKVIQYKRMKVPQWKLERSKEIRLASSQRGSGDEAIDEPKKIETGLTTAQEVQMLRHILTPIDELSAHGYVASVPSDAAIQVVREGVAASKGWEKCDRCQQRFQVFPGRREEDGALTSGGKCSFHWGKTYVPQKTPSDRSWVAKRYQCCGQEAGDSPGCSTHDHHVFKCSDLRRLATVLNFAETPQNNLVPSDRAVCFDCEMGYTVYGMELIRLTATAWPTGEELLDVLVQPMGEILDLNSRYSGVWPDDLALAELWNADTKLSIRKRNDDKTDDGGGTKPKKTLKKVSSPEVARDLLFSLLSPTTPLIGHGLENDLNAVRVVHPTLVDTVLLYPHRGGLPFRYSLKRLMDEHLNRKIQQETGPKMLGHDSAEDARAAGDLVRLKVANVWRDMKRDGWTLADDDLVPPVSKRGKGPLTEEFIER
ncbi:hypothetical protein HIM_03707 [Hirsutella minnesotensis 3608]|uniref:Exonuclease domain-containing protein n=1 Tax=Hirsutella minnesotensis 3608 TaxID=1043627 RepID=A0A0F7ZQ89_9HYPO|nr:hypothetical protein HIM_03707 [Hirsutella minnesotensis 3608]